MTNSDLNNAKKVHFIGIGGIGISAIARMMILQGKTVSGSDTSDSEIIKELRKLNCEISIGQKKENIKPDLDLVIYTIAVSEDNPELIKAQEIKIKLLTYPEALGLISKDFYTIAVSGTHGKTTTTAMAAKIFIDAGLKPTVITGSLLKDARSNFIAGDGHYFIVEACEYKRSFLELEPKILVITNIDNDHLDYYKDIDEIQKAFEELIAKIPKNGFLVCNVKDAKVRPVLKAAKCQIIDYSKINKKFKLKFPGQHNIENAKAAFAIGKILNVSEEKIITSLEDFNGTWRRFDFKKTTKTGILVYDDYAHHPTEIKATLKSFKEKFPEHRLIVVFQPHLFSRIKILLNAFAESFGDADEVILAPIYAAREKEDKTISSEVLAKRIRQNGKSALALENFEKIVDYLIANTGKNDAIITMGAGDIHKIGEKLM